MPDPHEHKFELAYHNPDLDKKLHKCSVKGCTEEKREGAWWQDDSAPSVKTDPGVDDIKVDSGDWEDHSQDRKEWPR